jgi:hypothetical protein
VGCCGWAGVMASRHKEIESNYMWRSVADIESCFTTEKKKKK